jgi:hypothetical protein
MPIAARLEVRGKDKSTLRSWVRASGIRAGLAQRARISSDGRIRCDADMADLATLADRYGIGRDTFVRMIRLALTMAADVGERQRVTRAMADPRRRPEYRPYDAIVLQIVEHWEALVSEAQRLARERWPGR